MIDNITKGDAYPQGPWHAQAVRPAKLDLVGYLETLREIR